MGGLVVSFIIFSFFFKVISDLTIEKHKQDTIETLDMIVSNINSFCNTRSLSTIKKIISLSDFVRVVYVSDNGDDQTINYTSHGSNICVKFMDDVECKPLVCQIEMRSYVKEESLISLIDKISGKLGYQNYILKIHRINDIVDAEISRTTTTTTIITTITTTTSRDPSTTSTLSGIIQFNVDKPIGVPYIFRLLSNTNLNPADYQHWGPFGSFIGYTWKDGFGKYSDYINKASQYKIVLNGQEIPKPVAVATPIIYHDQCQDDTPRSIYQNYYGRDYGYRRFKMDDGSYKFCGGEISGETQECKDLKDSGKDYCDIPLYATSGKWWEEWQKIIQGFSNQFKDDDRVQWVVISTGLYGENYCTKSDSGCPDTRKFELFYQKTVEEYQKNFKRSDGKSKPLFLGVGTWATMGEAQHVASFSPPVGLRFCGTKKDAANLHVYGRWEGWGIMDAFDVYKDKTYFCFEPWLGGPFFNQGRQGIYWRDLMILSRHSLVYDIYENDISENLADSNGPYYIPFVVEHLGVTVEDTTDVWIVLRDTEYLCCSNLDSKCTLPSSSRCADNIQMNEDHDANCASCSDYTYYASGERGDYDFWLYRPEGLPQNKPVVMVKGEEIYNTEIPSSIIDHIYSYSLRRTDESTGNIYMSFKVDNQYPPKLNNYKGYNITIIYLNKNSDTFSVEYTDNAGNQKSYNIEKSSDNSNKWVEINIELPDAYMGNGFYSGKADFRINCNSDGNEYIHMIKIKPLKYVYTTTTTVRTPEMSTTTTVREDRFGCGGEFKYYNPPYELYPLPFPLDFYGTYSSDPLRKIVDNCISLSSSKLERSKCIINWSYNSFPQTYDYSYNCWCVGQKNLRPNDVVSCAENLHFPDTCEGCGVCVDFSTTLYSMLVSCGPECNINTDNLYLVSGCLAGRKLGEAENSCVGCHSWLLYNHPNERWVFVDPTNPSLTSFIDQYFSRIPDYPCITFFIQNLDNNYMYSTPDDKVDSELCPGWGINIGTCPG